MQHFASLLVHILRDTTRVTKGDCCMFYFSAKYMSYAKCSHSVKNLTAVKFIVK
jgi:hypothetical protein